MDIETGGGWAKGKINEIFGPPSGGKSFISYLTIATNQALYPDANFALIDFEGAFDEVWAKKIGVDKTRLLIASPVYMEEGLDIADALIKSGEMFLIIVDSWAAACPKAELDGEMGDFTMGLRARLGNKFIRKYRPTTQAGLDTGEVDLGNTTLLIINQIYQESTLRYENTWWRASKVWCYAAYSY
jgi:recombination protein RecA